MNKPRPKHMAKYVADRVNLHPSTIRRWVDAGILPSKRDERKWRYFPNVEATLKRLEELGYPTINE